MAARKLNWFPASVVLGPHYRIANQEYSDANVCFDIPGWLAMDVNGSETMMLPREVVMEVIVKDHHLQHPGRSA
jgi:hypothetical protein